MMLVRRFLPPDAEALAALFHASVREGGRQHYSREQVEAWSPAPPLPSAYRERADRHLLFVAVDEESRAAGYADLRPDGYIDHLYGRPDMIGRGVGSAQCEALEAAATMSGLATLQVDASEGALRLLERRGFRAESRRDFAIDGVAIHNYRMWKRLG